MNKQRIDRAAWLRQIKQAVLEVEPLADVFLYGSRARGDAHTDSDWDFLILLDGLIDHAREQALRHHLYELEWETGEVISMVIRNRTAWSHEDKHWNPFRENIRQDAIAL